MKILLSPSKTLQKKPFPDQLLATEPEFTKQASELVAELRNYQSLEKLFGVSKKISDLNIERFKKWGLASEKSTSYPAAWMYRGETFLGLDVTSMDMQTINRAQQQLYILSGLYGYLRPSDRMYPYRLEMSTRLKGAWGRNLYEFWGDKLAKQIVGESSEWILNCASNEYSRSVLPHLSEQIEVVTPTFLHDGKAKMAFSKYGRGRLARWALQQGVQSIEQMKVCDVDGFRYDAKDSMPLNPIYHLPSDFTLKGKWAA